MGTCIVALLGIRHHHPRPCHLLGPEIPLVRGSVTPKANSPCALADGPLSEADCWSLGILAMSISCPEAQTHDRCTFVLILSGRIVAWGGHVPGRACRAARKCSGPAALGHWGACTIGQAAGPGLGGCGFYFAEAAQAFHHPQASGITFCRRHSQQVSRLLCGPSLINQLLTCTYWVSPWARAWAAGEPKRQFLS